MAKAKSKIKNLPTAQQISGAAYLVAQGTGKPANPAGSAPFAGFTAASTGLATAYADAQALRGASKAGTTALKLAKKTLLSAESTYKDHVNSTTGGNAGQIQDLGFDVQQPATPTQLPTQVLSLKVEFTGMEGYSKLSWEPQGGADHYVIERSPDPIVAGSFVMVGTSPNAGYEGNGAIAGQKCWYRVAAVNIMGQGPWSDPALRPVM